LWFFFFFWYSFFVAQTPKPLYVVVVTVVTRGFIKFLCRRSVGFYSWAFLVFLMRESKKRRRKQPGKLMAKSCSQPVNLPGAWPSMNPLSNYLFSRKTIWNRAGVTCKPKQCTSSGKKEKKSTRIVLFYGQSAFPVLTWMFIYLFFFVFY